MYDQAKLQYSVVAAIVAQLVYANRAANSTDPSFDSWPAVVCAQIVQSLSLTTACVLYIGPLLDSVASGMIRSDDLRRRGKEGAYGYGSSNRTPKPSDLISSEGSRAGGSDALPVPLQPLHLAQTSVAVSAEEPQWEDGQSTSSQIPIIKYTTSWGVATEDRAPVPNVS